MSGDSRILANQSSLSRGIRSNGVKIKLFVREEMHYSGYSTTELARMQSEGFSIEVRDYRGNTRVIDIPARPFMKQFFEANKAELVSVITERVTVAWLKDDGSINRVVDEICVYVKSMFLAWAEMGGIQPDNALYTIIRKGSDKALIDQGALLASIDTEGTVVTTR